VLGVTVERGWPAAAADFVVAVVVVAVAVVLVVATTSAEAIAHLNSHGPESQV
jgi:hypothetical protein